MSLTQSMNNALSGLQTSQRALSIVANNVANANTEGYTRKVHDQVALVLNGEGAGVRSVGTRRIVDDFLATRLREQQSVDGRNATVATLAVEVEAIALGPYGDSHGGFPGRVAELANAYQELANAPEKSVLRGLAIARTDEFFSEISTALEGLGDQRAEVDREIERTVVEINRDLVALDEVNAELAHFGASPDLADERDRLLASLAQKIDLNVAFDDKGAAVVTTGAGHVLLDHEPRVLHYRSVAPPGAGEPVFGPIQVFRAAQLDPTTGAPRSGETGTVLVTGGLRAVPTPEQEAAAAPGAAPAVRSTLAGGRLQGLLEARDRLIPDTADQLGELGELARYAINRGHNQSAGIVLPETVLGTRTSAGAAYDAATGRTGAAHLAVVDASDRSVSATIELDLTQPFATLLGDLQAGLAGFGTATVDADGRLAIDLAPGLGIAVSEGDGAVTVADAAGLERAYGFSHFFGLNDLVVSDGAVGLRVADAVRADPTRLGGARLDILSGPPPAGSLGGPGDGRGFLGLVQSLEEPIASAARGGLPAATRNVADYAAELVESTATRVARAEDDRDRASAILEDLAFRQGSVSGVNLDEELAKLVVYQQSYVAAARVLAVADELLAELLSIAR